MNSNFLHRRIRHHITALILEKVCQEGQALPSVRSLAVELNANPLTVARAYEPLLDDGVIEPRRGVGFFVARGGVERLRSVERQRFLEEIWPEIAAQLKRLKISRAELVSAEAKPTLAAAHSA